MAYTFLCEGNRVETQVAHTKGAAAWANEFQDQLKDMLGPKYYQAHLMCGAWGDAAWTYSIAEVDVVTLAPCWKWAFGSGAGEVMIPLPWAHEGMRITGAQFVVKGSVAGADDGGILLAKIGNALVGGKPANTRTTYLVHTDPWDQAGGYAVVPVTGLTIDLSSDADWYAQIIGPTGAGDSAVIYHLGFTVQLDHS